MDPVTLPMTISELRVLGAPILVRMGYGFIASGIYLRDDGRGFSVGYVDSRTVSGPHSDFALDLHHPNGERIADLVLRPCPPTADRETLEGIRDAVLRAVSA